MNSKRAWIVYTLVRLLAFAIPFAVVMLAVPAWQWNWLVGAAAGAIISVCVSIIFLRRSRAQMGSDIRRLRERSDTRSSDDVTEDAALDAQDTDADAGPSSAAQDRPAAPTA